jgi:hypothetical protein
LALDLQTRAESAASDLALANTVATSGVVNPITGVIICAAANTCTAAEKLLLGYEASKLSRASAEATLAYIAAVEAYGLARIRAGAITATAYATGTAALSSAYAAALLAQTAANAAITSYNALATALGLTGTTIAASSGTTGSVGATATVSYVRGQ